VGTAPPPPIKKETIKPPPPKTISLGVVNGKASNLPKPVYSAIAKAAHAHGTVTVQVLIDESGKVVSAQAISGHPLLLKESVQAAYQARFTPTLLSKQPVKVSGVITYNFVM
jgi:TonB family protein